MTWFGNIVVVGFWSLIMRKRATELMVKFGSSKRDRFNSSKTRWDEKTALTAHLDITNGTMI
jgi:hypothetical protein